MAIRKVRRSSACQYAPKYVQELCCEISYVVSFISLEGVLVTSHYKVRTKLNYSWYDKALICYMIRLNLHQLQFLNYDLFLDTKFRSSSVPKTSLIFSPN